MARLPEGTTTFMLTDLLGSTRAWESQPKEMRAAMVRHDAILAGNVRDHAGRLVEAGREGDSVLAVFRTAAAAAACALDIQKKFATESWPEGLDLKVRIALHTGEAQLRDGHYFGSALNRCARLLAVCYPGQILLTKATESMLADELPPDADLQDLGLHRFKDLARPDQVFQLNDLAHPYEFPRIQSLPLEQTNIPSYLTSFVGRAADLNALPSMLATSRMVTLTGAGGSGKTRLAAELGRAYMNLFPGGVWWVELAALKDAQDMPGAVVAQLGLNRRRPPLEVITAWLASRQSLLVLDSCEHVVVACADLCQATLERCPELAIIATSREALGVAGEARWPVSSMEATDAVQLFETRARLVVPAFKVAAANIEAVTQICARLDYMPLAIELAAARLGMMSEQEILSQLSDRFGLLTGGSRTAQERHQTMIATIDWSYRLLTKDEALLFRRLSVFHGGFSLESVQAVCADEVGASVLDPLAALVQKSMVVAERPEGSVSRYRLLESQLAYAEDRLTETGELALMRRRHYQHFLDSLGDKLAFYTVDVRDRMPGQTLRPAKPPTVEEAAGVVREWANLWAATEWARTGADDMGLLLAVQLANTNFPDLKAMRRLLTDVLERTRETGVLRVSALGWASNLANIQGDYEAALVAAEASLALAREIGDAEMVANALLRGGNVHQVHKDNDAALEMYDEATALLKGSKNRRAAAGIRNNVALIAVDRGDYAYARDVLVACVADARAAGDARETASYLESLAWAELGLRHLDVATASWKEALAYGSSVMDNLGIVWCLYGLSSAASAYGDDQRALRLNAAAAHLAGDWFSSNSWIPKQSEESQRRSRSRFGARKSEDAWNEGWVMTVDQAIEYALGESEPASAVDAGPLSRRQREVATLLAAGLTNREIAERLFIAERSAEGHVERIRNKLGVRSRTEVATWAVEHGLMAPPIKERGTRDGPLPPRRGQPS